VLAADFLFADDNRMCGGHGISTERLMVPGGWLYRTIMEDDASHFAVAMVFVPDPDAFRQTKMIRQREAMLASD
jgi:hypothetical protein